jgi:hypothetical protein
MDSNDREKFKHLLEEKKKLQINHIQLQIKNSQLIKRSIFLYNQLEKVRKV